MVRITLMLCPVDFSDDSRRALDYAASLADWYGARLIAMHVHAMALPLPMDPMGGSQVYASAALSDEERGAVLKALDTFVAGHRSAGRTIEPLVEEAINVPNAIVSRADALGAELIVMGTHGRTGFNRLVLGSATEKVLRTAPCPVVAVPPRAAGAGALGEPGSGGVLCPTDFSPSSGRTLRYAASLAQQARVPLTVVHVVDTGTEAAEAMLPDGDAYRAARLERARSSMATAIVPEVRQAADVTEVVAMGKPYREILRLAEERQAGLIVMGVHGRGAVDRMFFGSTTQHVVRQAKCPVLTVRDPSP